MEKEILFGKRISRLRREIAELETDMQVLASLHTYTPAMDQFDLRATVRDLEGTKQAAQTILIKLEKHQRNRT